MAHWLLKTEPDSFSIDDLKAKQSPEIWEGIRNYQARNIIRDQIKQGDTAFIYHSSCKQIGIAGVANIVTAPYPCPFQYDPTSDYFDAKATQEKPRWYVMDVTFSRKFEQIIPLSLLKTLTELKNMALIKQGRLSVQPVTTEEYNCILALNSSV